MEEYVEYQRYGQELQLMCRECEVVIDTLSHYTVQLLLFESNTTTTTTTSIPRELKSLRQQVAHLQLDKKAMERKFALEKLLLESKVELHKKNLKFLTTTTTTSTQPNSITSNKLIHSTTSFSTTPYLQKIALIKLSRVTPINAKIQSTQFTTSTPGEEQIKVSPLRGLIQRKQQQQQPPSIFDDTHEDEMDTSNKYKKIKLSHHLQLSDDEEESLPKRTTVFKTQISPLKTNNIFKI